MRRVGEEAQIIGRNMKLLREMHGYSQKEIARLLRISFQQVQKYENGANRVPVEKVYTLKHFYNVPFPSFFEGLSVDMAEKPASHDMFDTLMMRVRALRDEALREKICRAMMVLVSAE